MNNKEPPETVAKEIEFFDCDAGVGATGLNAASIREPGELIELMDRYLISTSLVYDRAAVETGAFDSFDFIVDFCSGTDRLIPTIPIVPSACREQPAPRELLAFIEDQGIGGAHVFPLLHNFDMDPDSMGSLLELLEEHRIPVIYHSMGYATQHWDLEPDWGRIRETADAFPELPIIISSTGMLQGRRFFPLMEQCSNIRIDLTCAIFQTPEHITDIFGPERIVVATHLPFDDPGLYTTWISYSALSDTAKRKIGFGNMKHIIEAIQ